jgi:hypothetical protein
MSEQPQPPVNDDEEPRQGLALLGVLGAVVAAILLAWFAMEFADWNKLQECALSGRRNCAPATSSTR